MAHRIGVTVITVCGCLIFSLLADSSNQVAQDDQNAIPPLSVDSQDDSSRNKQYLLYQIDRDIRTFSFEDVDEMLSYEDDNIPYALAEKLKQNDNNTPVIVKNLQKVKSYLEREKEKKQPSTFVYLLKIIVMLGAMLCIIVVSVLCCCSYYDIIQSKMIEVRAS